MSVTLVGAGPGAADLITVRGAQALATADVVAYDRLGCEELLQFAPDGAELIAVGKGPGDSYLQSQINALLIDRSHKGLRVVRLKGGDPFVLGRGGEEAFALMQAGIDFEVVPGISSAIAVPAAAGIPVTHRGVSAAFTVVSGQDKAGSINAVDWHALARVRSTIVILMGVRTRGAIAAQLIEGGLPPSTPVAIVSNGTTPLQTVVRGRLDELATLPATSPSAIVIGAVAEIDLVNTTHFIEGLSA